MIELSVIVPTFNERANVEEFFRRLCVALGGLHWEVVFVDDDSSDGTADAVHALARTDARVRCLQRIGRRGLSRAVIEGVLSTTTPVIAVIDADLQHDEGILPLMWAQLQGDAGQERKTSADIVIGSRYAEGGGLSDWDAGRARLSGFATVIAQRIMHVSVSDPMSGFFMMRRPVFNAVVRKLSGEGYKLLLDILASSPPTLIVREVPYRFKARVAGESKLDSAVLWEFCLLLLDKKIGRWLPARFVLFSLVGTSGVIVHFTSLFLIFRLLNQPFVVAQTFATLVAMTSNYALNNSLTYRDQRHRGLDWLRGILSFYAVCGLGVIANVGMASALFKQHGWALAALAGALVGTVWNFAVSRLVTWRKR